VAALKSAGVIWIASQDYVRAAIQTCRARSTLSTSPSLCGFYFIENCYFNPEAYQTLHGRKQARLQAVRDAFAALELSMPPK